MAKTAQDYPITFGYLATTKVNGKPYLHRGTDRGCPIGIPIVIGGTIIGLTGNTGLTTGAHLHLQAGTDPECQNIVNPEPYAFQPGVVTAVRTTDTKQWGKFITLKVGNRYITYAHLDRVDVKVGDVVGGQVKGTQGGDVSTTGEYEFNKFWLSLFGPMERNQPTANDRKRWIGKETNTVFRQMEADPRHAAYVKYIADLEKATGVAFEQINEPVYKKK